MTVWKDPVLSGTDTVAGFAIEADGLAKHYKNFTLQDIRFRLPTGCIMGVIGENGAGKTTTMKLLLNAVQRDGGCVRVLGKDTASSDFHAVKEKIGVVMDTVGFPELMNAKEVRRILKNTYDEWDDDAFWGYLERFSLPDNKRFRSFSRGMKTKFGLACALSHHPSLLLLDEVTSGLDPVAREDVLSIFTDFTRDESHSILISSHMVGDLERICDYITFFHKGQILLCEEKDRLLEEYGLLRCAREELSSLDPEAVRGRRETGYGVTALVLRAKLPQDLPVSPVSLEELFVYTVKNY